MVEKEGAAREVVEREEVAVEREEVAMAAAVATAVATAVAMALLPLAPKDKSRHPPRNALPANPAPSAAAPRPNFARHALQANSAATV